MSELSTSEELRSALARARTIAVLGAHDQRHRPAFYVPDYLFQQGYRVLPVNPTLVGRTLWSAAVVGSLSDLSEPVDLIDVFRRSSKVGDHVAEMLALSPLPRVVWLQLGVKNDPAARELMSAGIDVVQDACTLAEHRRLRVGPVG